MADSLEERLRSHERSFDGLLSLIPAKYYYGEDTSDQWQRKKQTKEQARNAKRAKLDPDASKSAKDVMDENARKRKRGEDENEDGASGSESEVSLLDAEAPREGMKRSDKVSKKQKKGGGGGGDGDDEKQQQQQPESSREEKSDPLVDERRKQKEEKKAAKQERQKQKHTEKLEKRKQKENNARETAGKEEQQHASGNDQQIDVPSQPADTTVHATVNNDKTEEEANAAAEAVAPIEGFSENIQNSESTAPTSPSNSHPFDNSNAPSGGSSISSILPPEAPSETSTDPKQKEQQHSPTKPPKPTSEELKQRLQKRLEDLRAARHADGLNGKPARNRQELIEARRQREEKRRVHKKELRQKAKEEEQRQRDEAIAKRFSSPRGSLLASPGSPADSIASMSNNFSFGRVVFADGQQTDPSLTGLREEKEKKQRGPQDAATALQAAEAKKTRIEAYDDEKRADVEEKEMWLNAKKRAHGERVKDDVSLLKKSLNRKESAKKKSEKQWKDRLDTVTKGKEAKQAKREENLRKRREEKGKKGKKGKAKARPGFEGSFKTKPGKK